jgi:hypothetical protein
MAADRETVEGPNAALGKRNRHAHGLAPIDRSSVRHQERKVDAVDWWAVADTRSVRLRRRGRRRRGTVAHLARLAT